MLQGSVIVVIPLHLPPFVSLTATALVLVRVPAPQETVQDPTLQRPH